MVNKVASTSIAFRLAHIRSLVKTRYVVLLCGWDSVFPTDQISYIRFQVKREFGIFISRKAARLPLEGWHNTIFISFGLLLILINISHAKREEVVQNRKSLQVSNSHLLQYDRYAMFVFYLEFVPYFNMKNVS